MQSNEFALYNLQSPSILKPLNYPTTIPSIITSIASKTKGLYWLKKVLNIREVEQRLRH
jgi:hypothetical protein